MTPDEHRIFDRLAYRLKNQGLRLIAIRKGSQDQKRFGRFAVFCPYRQEAIDWGDDLALLTHDWCRV